MERELAERSKLDGDVLKIASSYTHRSKNPNDHDRLEGDVWTQEKLSLIQYSVMSSNRSSPNNRGPPILPPHLLHIHLNKGDFPGNDPVLLPVPPHVCLNHLYAMSVVDDDEVICLSSTFRYRKKCVTTILYKPVEQE